MDQPERNEKKKFSFDLASNPKLRTALSAVAIIVALVAIVIIVATGWGRAASDAEKLEGPTTGLLATGPDTTTSPIPTIPEEPSPTLPPIDAGDNVTITPVEIPNDITPDKSPTVPPEHPEYIEAITGDGPYASPEGAVYKNDRTISIDVLDTDEGKIFTYTFGVSLGTINRFLYLNPVITDNSNQPPSAFFRFDAAKGTIITAPVEYRNQTIMYQKCRSYTVRRAMDLHTPAIYGDSQHPGTVWYADTPIDHPVYIDIIIYNGPGTIKHLLRLWIDKDEDGCYFFANIENRDLQYSDHTVFSSAEIYRLYQMAAKDMYDSEKLQLTILEAHEPKQEEFCFEYRARKTGCYYPYFVPAKRGANKATAAYANMEILAVTLRKHSPGQSVTLYYHILLMPNGEAPGIYEYIGRDYPQNDYISVLQSHGYPGYD